MQDAAVAKKTKTSRSKPARGATSTPTGRQNVILERIEEQQRVVIEAVTSNREALERRMDEQGQKLSSRIDVLEIAVRSLAADVRQNTADIRQNSADIQAVAIKLDTRAEAGRVAELEERVEVLESRP